MAVGVWRVAEEDRDHLRAVGLPLDARGQRLTPRGQSMLQSGPAPPPAGNVTVPALPFPSVIVMRQLVTFGASCGLDGSVKSWTTHTDVPDASGLGGLIALFPETLKYCGVCGLDQGFCPLPFSGWIWSAPEFPS